MSAVHTIGIETRPVVHAMEILDQVANTRQIGLLLAGPGQGKTTLLRQFTLQQCADGGCPAMLYRAEVVNTPLSLLRSLASVLGLETRRRTTRQLFPAVSVQLRMQAVDLILIDDAERLSAPSLDLVRALIERVGLGVVLCGRPQLVERLCERCPALAHQVTAVHSLENADPDDAYTMMRAAPALQKRRNHGDWLPLSRVLAEASGGNMRRMTQLLEAASRRARASHRTLSPHLVAQVAGEMAHRVLPTGA